MFFGNTLLISWKAFDFVSMVDSLMASAIFIGKIFFYFGFTFLIQSILKKDKINASLKMWMISVMIAGLIIAALFVIDDSSQESTKEIGIASVHNFKITMFAGHDGADMIQYLMIGIIMMDFTYFGVLLYLYINGIINKLRCFLYLCFM